MWSRLVLAVVIAAAAGLAPKHDEELSCFLLSETGDIAVFGDCRPEKDCPLAERDRRAGRTPSSGNCDKKLNPVPGVCCPPAKQLGAFEVEPGKGCFHRAWQIPGTCTPLAQCGSAKLEVEKGLQPQPCGDRTKDDEVCCAPTELTCYGYPNYAKYTSCSCVDHLNSLLYAPKNGSEHAGEASVARSKCREYGRYSCDDPIWSRNGVDVNLRLVDNCKIPQKDEITYYKEFRPEGTGYDKHSAASSTSSDRLTKMYADELPHMALLGNGEPGNVTYHCSGSLISPDFILTAAHCDSVQWAFLGTLNRSSGVDDPYFADYEFVVYPQLIEVQDVILHPDYNQSESYNDIALLRLKEPAAMTRTARPACLHLDKEVPDDVVAAGWGPTSDGSELPSEVLIKMDLKTKPLNDCDKAVDGLRLKKGLVEDSHLCAGGEGIRDTCPGNSGGPLMVRKPDTDTYCMFNILGVVSFGPQNCGEGFPSVYTPVAPYVPWIESVVWPA